MHIIVTAVIANMAVNVVNSGIDELENTNTISPKSGLWYSEIMSKVILFAFSSVVTVYSMGVHSAENPVVYTLRVGKSSSIVMVKCAIEFMLEFVMYGSMVKSYINV